MGKNLDVSQQCALAAQKADGVLDCTHTSTGSRAREGILPFCSVRPPPPAASGGRGAVGVGPEEATRMGRGWSHRGNKQAQAFRKSPRPHQLLLWEQSAVTIAVSNFR